MVTFSTGDGQVQLERTCCSLFKQFMIEAIKIELISDVGGGELLKNNLQTHCHLLVV